MADDDVDIHKTQAHPRDPHMWEAVFVFLLLIAVMVVAIAVFEANPHIPMLLGAGFGALMAMRLGWTWVDVETMMYDGVRQAMQAIVILAVIGILIGVWLLAGVVPTMIYYGLGILNPSIFLVVTVLICSVTSLATGTSWGTAGTIGIALMGIGLGLGVPAPMAAGAVISGAYFGDKLSPLSDTTNLAPAMAGTDVFTHVKFMLRPTGVAYVLSLVVFGVLGLTTDTGAGGDLSVVNELKSALAAQFTISPILLLPPLVVILLMAFKVPAIPGITAGIFAGAICAPIFQGASFGDLLTVGYDGFTAETGVKAIDELLDAGGLTGMFYSISLTIFAMMFGGIVEGTGQLRVLVAPLLRRVKSAPGLIGATMGTSVVSNITMPEQYISVVVPGRMYAKVYEERGYHPKMLSNALESAGTVLSPLVPWNTCGVFMLSVLGVSTFQYAPYAVFNYLTPLATLALAYLGVTVAFRKDDPTTIVSVTAEEVAQERPTSA